MEKTLLYKDIVCKFSSAVVEAVVGGNKVIQFHEKLHHMLDSFFENEPVDQIKWVSKLDFKEYGQDTLPMYTMSNGRITVLFWPYQNENGRLLFMELMSERPELSNELDL